VSDFIITDGNDEAKSLIYATWLRSYKSSSPRAKNIPRDVFFAEHHDVIAGILDRSTTEVKLAVLPDDPDVVLGWAVTEPGIVHYVYVKHMLRRHGLATALLAHVQRPFTYTHWTYVVHDLEKYTEGCTFNPYLVAT
jgi:GNAT superfamily N-acetyltransferase